MRGSVVVKGVTVVVLLVGIVAVGLGLASPDGEVRRDDSSPTDSATTAPTAAPTEPAPGDTTDPDPVPPPADPSTLSPVTGIWPGRPAAAVESGGTVDWCPAVVLEASTAALNAVGHDAALQATCRAVAFTFEVRYSSLSLPRQQFTPADFDVVLAHLAPTTRESTYPQRIAAVVANPRSVSAREGTGVVLLNGPGPGGGREYFGSPWSTDGYAGRPVWIDPSWTTVRVDLKRGGSRPQLTVSFDATAAVPVWNPATSSPEKLTVKTSGSYVMSGPDWRINGWTLRTDQLGFTPLT